MNREVDANVRVNEAGEETFDLNIGVSGAAVTKIKVMHTLGIIPHYVRILNC